jgi:hypothetical protein
MRTKVSLVFQKKVTGLENRFRRLLQGKIHQKTGVSGKLVFVFNSPLTSL